MTDAKLEQFLELLANGDTVKHACATLKIGRRTIYDQRERDPEFAQAWELALDTGIEELEQEAKRRALDGSDRLLEFLLRAKRPEVYRENYRVEHTGAGGAPIQHEVKVDADEIIAGLEELGLVRRDLPAAAEPVQPALPD